MLLTLVIYIVTMIVLQKNPYSDRIFLMVLNVMLLLYLRFYLGWFHLELHVAPDGNFVSYCGMWYEKRN